jgi:putative ABC transport system permease protein
VLGVAAALVLVMSTGAMVDSMRTTFDVIYGDAERYDLRVDLVRPMPASEVRALVSDVPGATRVEELASMPVELRAHGATTNALLRGLRDDATLVRSMDLDRRVVTPEPGGIVLARSTARSLGAGIGDRVHARVLPDGAEADFRVSGLADGVFGDTATVRIDDAARALGLGDRATAAVLRVRAGELDRARSAVAALPEAAHVEDLAGTRQQMSALMGLGWVMIGTMLLFSVILAAAILFNTATLDILERRRELATLRALGRSQREIAIGTTIEHAVLALIGFGVGIPLSIVATKKTLALFSSDLFQLPFVLSPATIGAAGIGIVLVLLLAQWPALRSVARASLADMVRVRS